MPTESTTQELMTISELKEKSIAELGKLARGLDIADVTHVINYDIPATYDDYVAFVDRLPKYLDDVTRDLETTARYLHVSTLHLQRLPNPLDTLVGTPVPPVPVPGSAVAPPAEGRP